MKLSRLFSLCFFTACIVVLASFRFPSPAPVVAKNVVYKVSYDTKAGKLTATEKLEVSSDLVQRNAEGKVINVNKDAIMSQMPMASRMMSVAGSPKRMAYTYALVSVMSESKTVALTDTELLNYLQKSFESYTRNAFTGGDYTVSGNSWSCAGGSCNMQVPPGVEVFVWEQ